ncbi:polymorphic toxin-type HINT domain-containing protein [Streptomyces sp. NPDC090445]|uniref:polymorphic toxin-type HINT domain-containing protein n=1 Tax=Streptomyces sp. NPDC090445 TaxID=3365963 RepID=UPI0037FB642F
MGDGATRPIEQIKIGDNVFAADPVSGASGPRRVDDTIYTPDDQDFTTIALRPEPGEGTLTSTDHHPFWAQNRGQWTYAAELNAGDTLRTPGGDTVEIGKITRWKGLQPAYNLTVNGLHTYYVLVGGTPVLVHNSDPEECAKKVSALVKAEFAKVDQVVKDMGYGNKRGEFGREVWGRGDESLAMMNAEQLQKMRNMGMTKGQAKAIHEAYAKVAKLRPGNPSAKQRAELAKWYMENL